MAYDKTLSEVVERVVKERFSDAVINSVEIKMDVDSDGDPVLLVTVVFDANNELLNKNRMVGLVRHLRSELGNVNFDGFPLVSFISRKEAEKLRLETA